MMRLLFNGLLLATGAIYLVMVLWSLPLITAEADGLMPFDLRPLGYSVEQAEAFNNALSDEGRVFYLETQHWLDALFPVLLTATLIWVAIRIWTGAGRWLIIALALVGGAADYLENAAVARLLAEFNPVLVAEASRWTMVKSWSITAVFLTVLVVMGRRLWLQWRR